MYSAFCDYHTKEIYDVPSFIGFFVSLLSLYFSKGFNFVLLKQIGICVVITLVITLFKCINWGDAILFVSIIPSLCLISSDLIYPFLIILFASSFLGVIFNIKNFITKKESTYPFAPFIYAGYVIGVIIYGL